MYGFGDPRATYGAQIPMYGEGGQYGASAGGALDAIKSPYLRNQRKRMNIAGILLSLLGPWIIFMVVCGVMSFSIHYKNPGYCYFTCVLCFIIVVVFGLLAVSAVKARIAGETQRSVGWFVFLAVTSVIAWAAGIAIGDVNFWSNLQPYYDIQNLNEYPEVDPSKTNGQQMMDAGRIVFTEGSALDLTKSMGFKNLEMYCVAPISIGTDPLESYDFWAVGLNCCTGDAKDFHCGEYKNPNALAGLRLMNDDQRSFFRLAVQQAEANYNLKASHPLFFHWMQDPLAEMNSYQDDGVKYFMLGIFSHFMFQLFLTVCATVAFAKWGL